MWGYQLKFSSDLIIGNTIENKEEIIDYLKQSISIFNVYILCSDRFSSNLMEIISSNEIFKPIYLKKDYTVLGIAGSKREAFNIAVDIIKKKYL